MSAPSGRAWRTRTLSPSLGWRAPPPPSSSSASTSPAAASTSASRSCASALPAPDALDLIEQLQQIATGMEYLHALQPPVLHRDLKSANVLIAEGGQRIAIADFGLARYQANPGKKMTAETGSYRWMAPEVIRHEEYDKRCDVYSFAILAWEMLATYRVPFDNMSTFPAPFRDSLSLHSPLETPPMSHATFSSLLSLAVPVEAAFAVARQREAAADPLRVVPMFDLRDAQGLLASGRDEAASVRGDLHGARGGDRHVAAAEGEGHGGRQPPIDGGGCERRAARIEERERPP